MKRYLVILTESAVEDMEELYDYISGDLQAPESAAAIYNRIANAIESLELFPARYRIMVSEPERSLAIRKMPVGNYSVCYRITGDSVNVIGIFYGASDTRPRLQKRL